MVCSLAVGEMATLIGTLAAILGPYEGFTKSAVLLKNYIFEILSFRVRRTCSFYVAFYAVHNGVRDTNIHGRLRPLLS